jgi:hypothetical protein
MSPSNENSVAKDVIDWGRHCEERSDEAIQFALLDCFATLAMTAGGCQFDD